MLQASLIVEPRAIARKADEVFEARIRDRVDLRLVGLHEKVVMLLAIPCALDAAERLSIGALHRGLLTIAQPSPCSFNVGKFAG